MPHQIPVEIATKSDPKPWLETHTEQDMSEEPSDDQEYLKAKRRFPKLSFDTYYKNSCLFDDERIQASLPSKDAVRKYLDTDHLSLYTSMYKESQKAPIKQRLHELIEKGPIDERAKDTIICYLDCHLVSILLSSF
jgi:hypothetical protein